MNNTIFIHKYMKRNCNNTSIAMQAMENNVKCIEILALVIIVTRSTIFYVDAM